MAYWHNPDGTPAKPFQGAFDWDHVPALVVFVLLPITGIVYALLREPPPVEPAKPALVAPCSTAGQ